jgi:PAS domain-containing protein
VAEVDRREASADFRTMLTGWLERMQDQDGSLDAPLLRAELETAAEELRIADEEMTAQQVEVARLLTDRQSLNAWHERVVTALPVPIVTTDSLGAVLKVNAAAVQMFVRPSVALLRRPLASLVVEDDRRRLRDVVSDLRHADVADRRVAVRLRVGPKDTIAAEIVATKDPASGAHVRWIIVPASTDDRRIPSVGSHSDDERVSAKEVAQAFSKLWQLPLHEGDRGEILRSVTAICHQAFPDVTWVSISLGDPNEPELLASDSTEAQQLDGLQMQIGQGPTQDAWRLQSSVVTTSMDQDERWPEFASASTTTGVESILATPILLGEERVGAVSLYSTEPSAFLEHEVAIGEWFASAIAAVLDDLQAHEELKALAGQLQTALGTRGVIDQAKGIIMAHRNCDPDEAFAHLVTLSSTTGVKLRDVARELVEQTQQRP